MPTPLNDTTPAATVQIVLMLLVAYTMGIPDAPPVAVSATAAAPIVTGDAGAKPVIACGNSAAALMMILAVACGAAA